MLVYKEALRYLCAKLNGKTTFETYKTELINIDEINKLIEQMKKILKSVPDVASYLPLIADEITVRYIEGPFQQLILEAVAARYLTTLEEHQKKKYSYSHVVTRFFEAFNTELGVNINPAVEFDRAIKGGIITFVDKRDKVLLAPYESPLFPADEEKKVQDYMNKCMEVVGKHLFHDERVVFTFLGSIAEYGFMVGNKPDGAVEIQAMIFRLLGELKSDEDFRQFMNGKLTQAHKKCMDLLKIKKRDCLEIADFLLQFYRVPFQTYINEPTMILLCVYANLFGSIDNTAIIDNLTGWQDDEKKKIRVWFGVHEVKFQFLRRGAIGRAAAKPAGIMIQDLTISVPRPGRPSIKDPVSLQFYYEKSKNISATETAELNVNLERIAFVLKLLNFPPLREVISK